MEGDSTEMERENQGERRENGQFLFRSKFRKSWKNFGRQGISAFRFDVVT